MTEHMQPDTEQQGTQEFDFVQADGQTVEEAGFTPEAEERHAAGEPAASTQPAPDAWEAEGLPDARVLAERLAAVEQALLLGQQLQRITALDPAITSWQELAGSPKGGEVHRLVGLGCTPEQAFVATHFEEILRRRAADAHRAGLLAARTKRHLTAQEPGMGDGFSVPPEVMRQYRAFFPSWSEARIRSDYRKRQSGE